MLLNLDMSEKKSLTLCYEIRQQVHTGNQCVGTWRGS